MTMPLEYSGPTSCCLDASRACPRLNLALTFVAKREQAWPQYMQVLLTSTEFSSVN